MEWAVYTVHIQCMFLCRIGYSVRSCHCVVHVNHLLAVDMAGVARRDCGVRVFGKMSKDIGM